MLVRRRFDLASGHPRRRPTTIVVAVALSAIGLVAQSGGEPSASLVSTTTLEFPHGTDSNSPAVWERVDGRLRLSVMNSMNGRAQLSEGRSLDRLAPVGDVAFSPHAPAGGVWFESVIRDADRWYGFYHNERDDLVCPGSGKVWPRIGAARSEDHGRTWTDLGTILETPIDTVRCVTNNHYFVGGVGDFSAVLDPDRTFVYL